MRSLLRLPSVANIVLLLGISDLRSVKAQSSNLRLLIWNLNAAITARTGQSLKLLIPNLIQIYRLKIGLRSGSYLH